MSHTSKSDPVTALHMAIIASKGGIARAAGMIGRSPGVMYNKFCDAMPTYEITVREAIALSHAVESDAFAEAVADQFGGVFLRLPPVSPGDDEVLDAYLHIIERMGDLSRQFTEARSDGVIDPQEFQSLRAQGNHTVVAILRLVKELEGMVREAPPPNNVKTLMGSAG